MKAEIQHAAENGIAWAAQHRVPGAWSFWVAEEKHDGIADEFVDSRSVLQRDSGHFAQILIEQTGEFLGFQKVGRFCKPGNIGKKYGQLLALRRHINVLFAAKN